MKFAVFLFFSSCIEESQLCRGMGLCTNNEDLEWCQNGQRILTSVENENLPYTSSWKPLRDHSECPLPNSKLSQTEISNKKKVLKPSARKIVSSHQQIKQAKIRDGIRYDCLNRGDEFPFGGATNNNGEEKIEKTWRNELVNEPCEDGRGRRCLGKAFDKCVGSSSK